MRVLVVLLVVGCSEDHPLSPERGACEAAMQRFWEEEPDTLVTLEHGGLDYQRPETEGEPAPGPFDLLQDAPD